MKPRIFSLLLSMFVIGLFQAQIERVEPAFWWKGMKNPELQILLYGKNIAHQTIELSNGIMPKKITKVENPNYVLITINIDEIPVSEFKIIARKGRKILSTYDYQLHKRKEGSAERTSFSSKDVVYLIMPDRFANGDTTNDSQPYLKEKANRTLPHGRHGGDLRGIINHLDYLHRLGITALWLTPVNEDNEKEYSYHGYAQTDLYKIDGRYGTNEEYRELSRELKKRGMKLVQDYVTNHWGISHWLIQDLPMQDWIHQFPSGEGKYGFKRSNYKTSSQFDTNVSEIDKTEALNGWFDTSMPDLNQANPFVLKYLIQNAIWWIEYAELDGLRVDTYPYNDKQAMAQWAKAITTEYPNLNIVGEAWLGSPAHIAYWQKDSKIGEIDGYNSYLPSVMDFPLYGELPKALRETSGWDTGMARLYGSFTNDFLYPDINNIMVFFENHDTERWNEAFKGDLRYYKIALSVIATVRGIPQLYYGSEVGMRGDKHKGGDAAIRKDFPGGWKEDSQNAFNEKTQTAEQKSFYDFSKKILNWRKQKQVIHSGKTQHFQPINEVYVYFRYDEKERVMVIINNNEKETSVDMSRYEEATQGFKQGKDIISGKKYAVLPSEKITIAGKSALILELEK